MKKPLLYLFLAAISFTNAQVLSIPYSQDFESETLGHDVTVDLVPIYQKEYNEGGTGDCKIANGNINSQVLLSDNRVYPGKKNHYLRTPVFTCTAQTSYTVTFDVYSSHTKMNFSIESKLSSDNFVTIPHADVTVTAITGTVDASKNQVVMIANTIVEITMVFEIPATHNRFKIKMYQFGDKTFELDNLNIVDNTTISTGSVEPTKIKLQSNLIEDSLTFQSTTAIEKAVLTNMTGTSTELVAIDNNSFDTSSIKSGFYILKFSLADGTSQTLKVIKK
tara:strand:+ start:15154 stop:15987 length:834 start_codon:yes stop_codon:yes gene_type:complete